MEGRKPPAFESLVVPRVAQAADQVRFKYAAPDALEQALQRVDHLGAREAVAATVSFGLICQQCILFVLNYEDFVGAAGSNETPPAAMPPLPFMRMAFEADEDATFALIDDEGNVPIEVEAFAICSVLDGDDDAWMVTLWARKPGPPAQVALTHRVLYFWLTPGFCQRLSPQDGPKGDHQPGIYKMAVEAVHLVNARGVDVSELDISRAARRRYQRATPAMDIPKVYYVHIRDAEVTRTSSRSDRTYTCRWLVRGHWRTYKETGRRTWIRPYIKGPAGAPWRGRPIYLVDAHRDAA